MYDERTRQEARRLLSAGVPVSDVARRLGPSRATIRTWRDDPDVGVRAGCPVCDGLPVAHDAYAALLGYYLGDGCVSQAARQHVLRVSCDASLPAVVSDVERVVTAVHPTRPVFLVRGPGVVVVSSGWKHWPCLFPQHGAGRKHEREIRLEPWQRSIVEAHPGPFLRGLFHSDGCRVRNWATRIVAGERKRYDYPRWQFSNRSDDIHDLCTWALDLVGIPWRRSGRWTTSVSRREAVAELDRLIGLKS
jgi:hypothetical protein